MGIFDFVEDVVDGTLDAVESVFEVTTETVVRLPEVGIRAVKGAVNGIEKGIEKVEDAFE